jgi:hypothetical protein
MGKDDEEEGEEVEEEEEGQVRPPQETLEVW